MCMCVHLCRYIYGMRVYCSTDFSVHVLDETNVKRYSKTTNKTTGCIPNQIPMQAIHFKLLKYCTHRETYTRIAYEYIGEKRWRMK